MTRGGPTARDDGQVTIVCPRCHGSVEVRYYGPCDDCRDGLRATLRNEARLVEREAFEPAMHVTPNAVAMKDDD